MFPPVTLFTLLGLTWTTVTGLPCQQMFPSQLPPANVNSVRPADVAVFSSIGLDVHSAELSVVTSRLQELMSLFNPALINPLSDESDPYTPQVLPHSTLMEQAKDVSHHLQNYQDSWKLLLVVVRVDQLCVCEQQQGSSAVEETVKEVNDVLRFLHSQLEKTVVSLALWDAEHNAFQSTRCPCLETNTRGEFRLHRAALSLTLKESLDELLVKKQWFGDRDDFTVILQETPLTIDPSFVASEKPLSKSQASQQTDKLVVQIWANLLQPTDDQHLTEDKDKIIALPCPTEVRPFLRTQGNSPAYHHSDASPLLHPFTGTEMPCEDLGPSPSIPTSVHELRPGDVKVVAAIGDSLTAGNGIASSPSNILDVLRQYRGLSWSIGGDGNLTTVTTLPNILKHFSPNVTGYSVGMGKQDTPQASLNQAVAGAKSKDLLRQAKDLVKRMKNDSKVDMEKDWKVITIFIGGNDVCDFCYNSLLFSVENYLNNVRQTLDYLHKQVPRALVNLIEPLHIAPLREMHADPSLKCPTWLVNILCPCVILPKANSEAFQTMEAINKNYQTVLNELVESGMYDSRPDFTVVVQPFFREIVVPRLPDGRPDRSFFSADCFHLSQKAQTQMARSLWNNMLEPLGNKTAKQDFTKKIPLKCPATTSPYIRTYNNSNYSYAGPSPTPAPIPNWGSDFSCVNLAPSDTVPTSVHRLRPADIKVVAALGDSTTAGLGAKAKTIFDLNKQYRGVSWSIGGDDGLDTVTTLPNILKKFNPRLKGFSRGQLQRNKGFNMAAPGVKTLEIQTQVQDLIKAMRESKEVNFEKDWKLVTVFVGEKDLCSYCLDQNNLSPKNYSHNLMLSLDALYAHVPRVLINVVEILQIDPLKTVTKQTLGCSLLQRTNCPCVINPTDNSPEFEEIKRINREYQTEIHNLLSGDRYDGKDDFAVVLQPFLHNYFIPHVGKGEADTSFFSADCLHISERAHAEMAIGLWNNMLEPVGWKKDYNNYTYDRSKIHCPSEDKPFIFTKMNSLPDSPVTNATTPMPTPTSTGGQTDSTFSPTVPLPKCPAALPVWVPVVAAIASLLVGIAVASVFCSCVQRGKKNMEKPVEMKGTTF